MNGRRSKTKPICLRSNANQFASFDVTRLAGDGVTVVTPNRRLAATLKRVYDDARQQAGDRAWVSPDIVPVPVFFARTCHALSLTAATPQHIDSLQSQLIWEQVIRQAEPAVDGGLSMLSISQTAKQVMAAWMITCRWQLQSMLRATPLHEDGQAFVAWMRSYQKRCRELNVIDDARLPDMLADRLTAAEAVLPTRLLTAGFDIVTPQLETFLQAVAVQGVMVETLTVNHGNTPVYTQRMAQRMAYTNDDAELRGAAQWARMQLEKNPQHRIAIVVPDLGARRGMVSRALTDALLPMARANLAADPASVSALFNISLGQPLGDYALVRDALLLLEFARQRPMAALDFSALLRSPHVDSAEREMCPRASLDAVFRDMGAVEISLFALQKKMKLPKYARLEHAFKTCPRFCEAVDRVAALPVIAKPASTPHHWRRHFTAVLAAWGFPGERGLSSTDFQVLAKFREALESLAALQMVQPRMRADEALAQLRRIVGEVMFQPESASKAEAPIQVLGILESAGQGFDVIDALWVSGLGDDAWPLGLRPNPFIPVGLQRRAGVPEASAASGLALDQHITQGWCHSAREVVFSHALRANKNTEVARAASVLIRDVALVAAITPSENYAEALLAQNSLFPLGPIVELPIPPLSAPTTVAGGAGVLRDQAACPFRAFARHRLGAQSLATPEAGLGAAERGNLIHRALCLAWRQIASHAALLALAPEALHALVSENVQLAIQEARADGMDTLTGRFATIEQARLHQLVQAWLAIDRVREPFEVLACEQARQIGIGNLTLRLRLDRLDRLQDGTDALIDYKTGVAQFKDWLGMRPDEPQLPLYFHTADHPVSAVAYARLKRGKTFGFEGVSATDNVLPGVTPVEQKRGMEKAGVVSWDVLVQQWEDALENLARQFADGINGVDPKNGAPTCAQCDLHSVCRVAEINRASGAGADDA